MAKFILLWNDEYCSNTIAAGPFEDLPATDNALLDLAAERLQQLFSEYDRESAVKAVSKAMSTSDGEYHDDISDFTISKYGCAIRYDGIYEDRLEVVDYDLPIPNRLEVETNAGKIVAEKNTDSGAPGVSIDLVPKGSWEQIPLLLTEVKHNQEYLVDDETPEDVCLYVFGDVKDEDFTDKVVIRKEELDKALKEND